MNNFEQKLVSGEWKGKKWADLSFEDKKLWEEFAGQNRERVDVWAVLCHSKKCLFCKRKMSLVIPNPGRVDKSFWEMLNPEWLVHLKTTHGAATYFVLAKKMGIEVPDSLLSL